jgi:hypothetical protein
MGSLKKVFESFYHLLFLGHSAKLAPVLRTGALSSLYAHGLHKHFFILLFFLYKICDFLDKTFWRFLFFLL